MPTSGAMDAQKALPQIAAAEIGVELTLDERGQGAPLGFTSPPHVGPMLGHTAIKKGLIEGARLVGPGAKHSIIFVFFSSINNPISHNQREATSPPWKRAR